MLCICWCFACIDTGSHASNECNEVLWLLTNVAIVVQDFEDEQGLVARLIHRLRAADPAQHYALLQTARNRFSVGGARRLRHTLPPIAFAALGIVRRLGAAPNADTAEPSPKEVILSLLTVCARCTSNS